MDSELPAGKARPRLNLYTKALRRERIFDRVRLGASIGDIASEERLSPQRVRKIVSDTLKRHQLDDLPDHALLQLFRLESAQALATKAIEAGDLKAIPPFLKILDHIDLYRKASIRKVIYDNEARENSSPRSTASPRGSRASAADRRPRLRPPRPSRRKSRIPTQPLD